MLTKEAKDMVMDIAFPSESALPDLHPRVALLDALINHLRGHAATHAHSVDGSLRHLTAAESMSIIPDGSDGCGIAVQVGPIRRLRKRFGFCEAQMFLAVFSNPSPSDWRDGDRCARRVHAAGQQARVAMGGFVRSPAFDGLAPRFHGAALEFRSDSYDLLPSRDVPWLNMMYSLVFYLAALPTGPAVETTISSKPEWRLQEEGGSIIK